MRRLWTTAAALVLLGACGGSDADGGPADTTAPATSPPTTTGSTLAAGQHQVGELVLTIHERVDPAPAKTFEPDPGTRWIAFDVEYTNPTSESVFASTYGIMELALADNRRVDAELIGTNDEPPVEGHIPPGSSLRGWVTFQVPEDAVAERLRVADMDNDAPPIEIDV